MIKSLYIFLLSFGALVYTACNNNSTTVVQTNQINTNSPPRKPYNPTPHDSLTEPAGTHITFLWSGGDPDAGDTARYDLYLDTSNPPVNSLIQGTPATVYDLGIPGPGVYFWQVIAKDKSGAATNGPVWRFTISP